MGPLIKRLAVLSWIFWLLMVGTASVAAPSCAAMCQTSHAHCGCCSSANEALTSPSPCGDVSCPAKPVQDGQAYTKAQTGSKVARPDDLPVVQAHTLSAFLFSFLAGMGDSATRQVFTYLPPLLTCDVYLRLRVLLI